MTVPSASDEEDGFPVFVQQHWRSLNRTAFLLTGDRGQAEDLVQSAGEGAPALAQSLADGCTVRLRPAGDGDHGDLLAAAPQLRRDPEPVDRSRHPGPVRTDRPAGPADRRAAPTARQDAGGLVLRYFEDLPEAEVAAALGCSVGTVKSQVSRGLQRLRESLESSPLPREAPAVRSV